MTSLLLAGTVVGTVLYGSYKSYRSYRRKVRSETHEDETAVAVHIKPDDDSPPPVPKRSYADIVTSTPINTPTTTQETLTDA